MFKLKTLKEIKQLVLYLKKNNLKLLGFVLIRNKTKF